MQFLRLTGTKDLDKIRQHIEYWRTRGDDPHANLNETEQNYITSHQTLEGIHYDDIDKIKSYAGECEAAIAKTIYDTAVRETFEEIRKRPDKTVRVVDYVCK